MLFFPQQRFLHEAKNKLSQDAGVPALSKPGWSFGWKEKIAVAASKEIAGTARQLAGIHQSIKNIGVSESLEEYDRRKLGIFNRINFFQLLTAVFIAVAGLFSHNSFPQWAWWVALMPSVISLVVLLLNARKHYDLALLLYFICYPVMTSIVYMSGINMGNELFFILYGILSVFFLHRLSHMLFSVSLSMISYCMLAVMWKGHRFQLESSSMFLYIINQLAGIVFIFYGFFLIKKENVGYQDSVLAKKKELADNALVLRRQTEELTELNNLKNKLFSVIAHDLKTPMYSLRSIFTTMQQQKIPAKEIKAMLPDMINNLNYTTGLMENLLQWAKSQMQSESAAVQPQPLAAGITETARLLSVQAAAKQITLRVECQEGLFVLADKNMMDLVLRNLLSNAIKFTPQNGEVVIGAAPEGAAVKIFVEDNGRGMTPEIMEKIQQNNYFSTNGTAHEPGTGLGLLLCRDFLARHSSQLCISSQPAKGSSFSFLLPLTQSAPAAAGI